jgi:RNA polymerase sigma factor (sigma-70 family)
MVLGVCRRLLSHSQDCEDAFQATFLVLLRKAGRLRRKELVANWLYGVAYRTALRARSTSARRRAHEQPLTHPVAAEPEGSAEWSDVRPVLDQELSRLPTKYRLPIVLCYFEGKTFEEAARQLGWPPGTVSGRIARAKELLRVRLTRRGVTLSAAALAGLFADRSLVASVPARLIGQLSLNASRLATIKATMVVMPASVAALTEGVLRAMFMSKMRIVAVLVLTLAVIGTGGGVATRQYLAAHQPKIANPDQPKAAFGLDRLLEPTDGLPMPDVAMLSEEQINSRLSASKESEKIKALLRQRYDAARTQAESRLQEFNAGKGTLDFLIESLSQLCDAERELSDKKADQIAAMEKQVQVLTEVEKVNQARFDARRIPLMDMAQARFNRLDAEIRLERAKAKP